MPNDNRRFLRIPIRDAVRSAVVRFDAKKTLLCELVNESAGGYAVAAPASYAAEFPPGRIVVLEFDDLVVQMKVAHGKMEEGRFLVGLERIAEPVEKAVAQQEQSAQRQSTLVRNLAIVVTLACCLLAWFFLPALLDQLQGKKKRPGSAPAAVTLPRLTR